MQSAQQKVFSISRFAEEWVAPFEKLPLEKLLLKSSPSEVPRFPGPSGGEPSLWKSTSKAASHSKLQMCMQARDTSFEQESMRTRILVKVMDKIAGTYFEKVPLVKFPVRSSLKKVPLQKFPRKSSFKKCLLKYTIACEGTCKYAI